MSVLLENCLIDTARGTWAPGVVGTGGSTSKPRTNLTDVPVHLKPHRLTTGDYKVYAQAAIQADWVMTVDEELDIAEGDLIVNVRDLDLQPFPLSVPPPGLPGAGNTTWTVTLITPPKEAFLGHWLVFVKETRGGGPRRGQRTP